MLRLFAATAGVVVSASSSSSSTELECPPMEIVILQDVSEYAAPIKAVMGDSAADEFVELLQTIVSARIGLGSFSDKPTPLRGWGGQRATTYKAWDVSYEHNFPLKDSPSLSQEITKLKLRPGGDYGGAQFEAMLYAALDKKTNWSKDDDDDDDVFKTIVVITNDFGHLDGDAAAGIAQYNAPRVYNVTDQTPIGGWGSPNFKYFPAAIWYDGIAPYDGATYDRFSDMHYRRDHDIWIPAHEWALWSEWFEIFGPDTWAQVARHPGKYQPGRMDYQDYPSLQQVAAGLNGVHPIILVNNPDNKMDERSIEICTAKTGWERSDQYSLADPKLATPCLEIAYHDVLSAHFPDYTVKTFSLQNLAEDLATAVLTAAGCQVPWTTTTEEETTTTTTEEETTTELTTTTEPTTTTEETTTEPTTTTETTTEPTTTTETTTEPTTTTEETTTEPTTTTETTTTETTTELTTTAEETIVATEGATTRGVELETTEEGAATEETTAPEGTMIPTTESTLTQESTTAESTTTSKTFDTTADPAMTTADPADDDDDGDGDDDDDDITEFPSTGASDFANSSGMGTDDGTELRGTGLGSDASLSQGGESLTEEEADFADTSARENEALPIIPGGRDDDDDGGKGMMIGAIAGATAGGLAALVALGILLARRFAHPDLGPPEEALEGPSFDCEREQMEIIDPDTFL